MAVEFGTVTKAEELQRLGFTAASKNLVELQSKKRKLALAYEHYRFVRQEKIDHFMQRLAKESARGMEYKTLSMVPIANYPEIPPDHVLESFSKAKDLGCFDTFEIAMIVKVKDPILFGRVNDCSDRFFIDQWDDDVKIEDILMPNEG